MAIRTEIISFASPQVRAGISGEKIDLLPEPVRSVESVCTEPLHPAGGNPFGCHDPSLIRIEPRIYAKY